jgi:hypothetical protein
MPPVTEFSGLTKTRNQPDAVAKGGSQMITIVILIAVVPAVAVTSIVVLLRVGIGREDADRSLRGAPSTRASVMTRRMVGLYVRMPQPPGDDGAVDFPQGQQPCDRRWPDGTAR